MLPPVPAVNPWEALEDLPGLVAIPAVWRKHLGHVFLAFQTHYLSTTDLQDTLIPCTTCGCDHRVTPGPSLFAHCTCDPPRCPPFSLTYSDITGLQLNLGKLGRELARALSLQSKHVPLPSGFTLQFGTWSPHFIPAILTLNAWRHEFRLALAELVARFNAPFILFAPTNQHFDAHAQELLARVHADFFTLESTLTITEDGTFKPLRSPAELFAQFNPQPSPPLSFQVSALSPQTPRYALRKHLGVWHLIFDGKEAFIRHERGLFYVAWLLYHPDETPIHALDLAAKIPEIYRQQLGLTHLTDPATGKVAPLLSGARIQERSLALDDAQSMRALFKKQKELEAILDSEDESEPVKDEALRELEAIFEFQKRHATRSKDGAQRTVRTVRRAITRLHHHLLQSLDENGNPHPVLRPFANHLQKHLLKPSAQHPGTQRTSDPLAGFFTYESPSGVAWTQ